MNTKLISQRALDMIEQYKNFRIGENTCSIPYFNNKTLGLKGSLKAEVGKGSPKDIYEEIVNKTGIQRIRISDFNSDSLKKFLVENNIGIDCSGLAYYVLNEESIDRNKGQLDKHIHFVNATNIFRKFRAKTQPEKNVDVATLADNKNSRLILINEIQPGDIITMIKENTGPSKGERNHILIINQIEYQNSIPVTLHYVHAIAWPTDGEYGHGIHEGKIEIVDVNKPITEQRWIELDKTGDENYTYVRAKNSLTEVRRLNWF